jgi:hypothetical protein
VDFRIGATMQRGMAPAQLIKVLEAFKTFNRTVQTLELSHNTFDQKALDELGGVLLMNRVLRSVSFQDFGLADQPAAFETFLRRLFGRGAPLEIPTPRVDFEEMTKKKLLDNQGLQRMLTSLAKIAAGEPAIEIPPETRTRVARPPEPSYRETERQTDAKNPFPPLPDEWRIRARPVPPPDSTETLRNFSQEYTLQKLMEKLKTPG